MVQFSVLIVNFNSGDRLSKAISALDAQTFRDFELLVFDNGSTDGSAVKAEKLATELGLPAKFVLHDENIGFAAANNRVAEKATGEWLAFLNPDAYPYRDWLERMLEAFQRFPFADAFGSTQIDATDTDYLDGAGDVYHVLGIPYRGGFGSTVASIPETGECFSPCGAAALYRRKAFETLGGFDERFFCYSEDVDLGFRLRLGGGSCIQVNNARVFHEGSGVTGRHSDFTVYHGNRNRIWVAFKNTPGLIYWPMLPVQVLVNLYLVARAYSFGIGKPYLRAVIDGYAGLSKFSSDRRQIQRARKASIRDIARAFGWSPRLLASRVPRLWPIKIAKSNALPKNLKATTS